MCEDVPKCREVGEEGCVDYRRKVLCGSELGTIGKRAIGAYVRVLVSVASIVSLVRQYKLRRIVCSTHPSQKHERAQSQQYGAHRRRELREIVCRRRSHGDGKARKGGRICGVVAASQCGVLRLACQYPGSDSLRDGSQQENVIATSIPCCRSLHDRTFANDNHRRWLCICIVQL